MQPTATATNAGRDGAGGAARLGADSPPDSRGKVRSLRIAVADDPDLHPFYQQVLAGLGHQVCMALTGRQLVEQCHLLRPDLVVAGVEVPDLDGLAAAEEICRDHLTPIILVLGNHDAELVQRALASQYVLVCLFKPVKEADLGPAIAVAMSRFEQFKFLRKDVADLRQALEDRKLIERAKGAVMRYTGLGEEDAYRRLRQLASDQNRKLVEVAQAITGAAEVFRQLEQAGPGEGRSERRARNGGGRHGTDRGRSTAAGRITPRPRAPVSGAGQAAE